MVTIKVKVGSLGYEVRPSHIIESPGGIIKRDDSLEEPMLFAFMEENVSRLMRRNQIGTATNYRAALGSFRRFRKGIDLPLSRVDHTLIEDYQAYLKSAGITLNSISFYMRIMRAVYNRAVSAGMVSDVRPFRSVFTGMEKTRKRALRIEEIRRIRALDLSADSDLGFARDIFMFLFFCRGMSFVDAAFLKKSDIREGVIDYSRRKTGQRLWVKIVEQIRDIMERYPAPDSPYQLPIIAAPGSDERRQYETALHRINKSLKIVGEMAGSSIKLTTYVCRHSWATIARNKNVPLGVISDALGHESAVTTQIYLDSIDTVVVDWANDIVLSEL